MSENEEVDVDTLVGKAASFYGVHANAFKFGDTAYEVLEDDNDGYRSALGHVAIEAPGVGIYFATPVATVRLERAPEGNSDFSGWQLVDTDDGHVWLRFGTDNCGDYYPMFVFEYLPKSPKAEEKTTTTKRFEACLPVMLREFKENRADDDHSGMEQHGVWIGLHAKDETDALEQLARLIVNDDSDGEERH